MLPAPEHTKTYKHVQNSFEAGLWHRCGQKQNTYFAGENTCGDATPALSSRPRRRIWQLLSSGADGMYGADALYIVSQGELMMVRDYLQMDVIGNLSEGQKCFGTLGKQVLILPDFAVLDTQTHSLSKKTVTLRLGQVRIDNQNYVDEDGIARTVKFNTLHCVDFAFTDYFKPGDAVLLEGTQKNDGAYTVRAVEEFDLRFDEHAFVPEQIEGCILTNRPPDMTCLCECHGRLWGFEGSRIYACAPGQPAIWYRYDGDAQSSYVADLPGKGDFTACISHGGRPVFFRSGSMIEILGDSPENYCAVETHLSGVLPDSAASLCTVGGELLYLSHNGVVRLSAGGTQNIDSALGTRLEAGFAASDGRRYWLCARAEDGQRRLYVYDTHDAVWHVQSGADLSALEYLEGAMYAYAQNGTVYMLAGGQEQKGMAEAAVDSFVEFYPLEDAARGQITPLRLGLRVLCKPDCRLTLYVSYDGGEWEKRAELASAGERLWYVPLAPRSCFMLGVRLCGHGEYSVRSIVKEYQ